MASKIDVTFSNSGSLGAIPAVNSSIEEISSPTAIFDLFRKFADNLVQEIGGRQIWSDYKGNLSKCLQLMHLVEVTHCGTTATALLAAIFGPDGSHTIMKWIYNFRSSHGYPTDTSYLKAIAPSIISKEFLVKKEPSSNFFAHTMALLKNNGGNAIADTQFASSHVFVVIQYAEGEDIHYRILQSCLDEFDLTKDLDKPSNFMKTKEFDVFINGFIKFFELSTWTQELDAFFLNYFHVESRLECNKPNPYFGAFPFFYSRRSSVEEIKEHYQEFEEVKKTQIFQKIMDNVIQ